MDQTLSERVATCISYALLTLTETEISSFWWNFHHWLHWKLSFWQFPVQSVMKISSKWQHFCFRVVKTRTTRTPAFWGYPSRPNDYPYHWVILDPKSKEDKVKVTNLKNSPKFQIWNGSDEYCWRYRVDTILSTDVQTDRRTKWYQYTPVQLRWSGGYNYG